jgi:hypothetical protein
MRGPDRKLAKDPCEGHEVLSNVIRSDVQEDHPIFVHGFWYNVWFHSNEITRVKVYGNGIDPVTRENVFEVLKRYNDPIEHFHSPDNVGVNIGRFEHCEQLFRFERKFSHDTPPRLEGFYEFGKCACVWGVVFVYAEVRTQEKSPKHFSILCHLKIEAVLALNDTRRHSDRGDRPGRIVSFGTFTRKRIQCVLYGQKVDVSNSEQQPDFVDSREP